MSLQANREAIRLFYEAGLKRWPHWRAKLDQLARDPYLGQTITPRERRLLLRAAADLRDT